MDSGAGRGLDQLVAVRAFSSVLALLAGALTVLGMTGRLRGWQAAVPGALVFLAAVGLLRNSAGGSSSGASALALIPVFQTALYSSIAPRSRPRPGRGGALLSAADRRRPERPPIPRASIRAALLSVTVSSIIGLTTQRLVAGVRDQAREARNQERMLGQVKDVVHSLFDSPQVRVDVCEAARTTSQASIALLYEPARDSDALRCTTVAGSTPARPRCSPGRAAPSTTLHSARAVRR